MVDFIGIGKYAIHGKLVGKYLPTSMYGIFTYYLFGIFLMESISRFIWEMIHGFPRFPIKPRSVGAKFGRTWTSWLPQGEPLPVASRGP